MKIDCISDLHGHYPDLEGGDLLIIAGDITASEKIYEWVKFYEWLIDQKYEKKVFIGGNHDNMLKDAVPTVDPQYRWVLDFKEMCTDEKKYGTYLCDSGTEYQGLKIWGSPWSVKFDGINPNACAFTVNTDKELGEKWALIPEDVNILITHSPPHGCYLDESKEGEMLGSISLRDRIYPFSSFKPKLHVFGHIHRNGGKAHISKYPGYGTENNLIFVNASIMNENYEPEHKPVRIIL